MSTGKFIVLEGVDGVGKTTQADLLATRRNAVRTFEPGATQLGVGIRCLLLDADLSLSSRAEALLIAADRAQHVNEVIRPALAAGRDVVSDRYYPSSLAYQSAGRGLGMGEVFALSQFATEGLRPDLVLLLEISDTEAQSRRAATGDDRFEAAGADFRARVAQAYRQRAERNPDRWVVINAEGSVAEVATRVNAAVTQRLDD